jgi:hypothetical protein
MIELRSNHIQVRNGFVYLMNDAGDVYKIGMDEHGDAPQTQAVSLGTGRWPFHLPAEEVRARIEGNPR